MNRIKRYLSALMCLALITTGLPVYAESTPEPGNYEIETVDVIDDVTMEPEASVEPNNLVTETPTAEVTAEATAEVTAEATTSPTPTPAPSIQFGYDTVTIDRYLLLGADVKEATGLRLTGVELDDIIWTTTDNWVINVHESYHTCYCSKAGTATLRAELATDPTVYDEITFVTTFTFNIIGPDTGLVGDTAELATQYLNGQITRGDTPDWTSSDETIASVKDGVVTGHRPGTVTISATENGVTVSRPFTILTPEISFTVDDIDMFSNHKERIVLKTENGEEVDYSQVSFVQMSGEAKDYFSIDADGYIHPILNSDGKLIQQAHTFMFSYDVKVVYRGSYDIMNVTVRQATVNCAIWDTAADDDADPDEHVLMYAGNTGLFPYGFMLYPSSEYDRVESCVSSDESVMKYDAESQTFIAVAPGKANITITMTSGATFVVPYVVSQPITSIDLKEIDRFLKIGETYQLEYTYAPANAEKVVYFSSSHSDLIRVDENGMLTALKPGIVTIKVHSALEGVSDSIMVQVVNPVTEIEIYNGLMDQRTTFTIAKGSTFMPIIKLFPKDATLLGYVVASSDPSVVEVTSAGKLKGVSTGTATIALVSLDGFQGRAFNVNVVPKKNTVTSFRLNYSKVTIYEGATKKITAKINSSAYDKSVTWTSDSPSVATVDANGVITAVAPGTATVYAMASTGAYKSVKVTVKKQYPTKVKLNVTKGSIYPGEEYQFKATISPSTMPREEMKVLTWKSSNTKVAIVNEEGYLYAIAPGRATITVTTVNGKKATCKVTVKKRTATSVDIVNPYTEFIVGGTYDLDAKVLPENVTNSAVTWSSSNKRIATVNSSTGVVTCKKAGTVKITAKAKDGSGKKKVITIKVVNMPLKSMNVTIDGAEVIKQSTVILRYGNSLTVAATSDPVMYVEYKSSDERVATFKDGVITATGSGTAKLTVTFGGQYARAFYVEVPYSPDAPRYRALVISQYTKSNQKEFLPFSVNSSNGIINALQLSDLEGSRYEVTYKKELASTEQVTSAIKTTFADAKEGDVSVVYLMTHGFVYNGQFVWLLTTNKGKTVYMYPADVMNALKDIKGDVVLMVLSCKSGGSVDDAATLNAMIRDLDIASGEDSSFSIICASDGAKRASYADTDPSFSYDFFTYGLCQSLGWDMRKSTEAAAKADKDGDGVITLKELAQATEVITREECAAYIAKYGSAAYFGPPEKRQDVTYYISPNADNIPVFAR